MHQNVFGSQSLPRPTEEVYTYSIEYSPDFINGLRGREEGRKW